MFFIGQRILRGKSQGDAEARARALRFEEKMGFAKALAGVKQ